MKYRFFKHLLHGGSDPDAERVYRWHIEERSGLRMRIGLATDAWKRSIDDYVDAARSIAGSMAYQGFMGIYPVPVDPDGELLDGSHRVACALALRQDVAVVWTGKRAWAPAWDRQWFELHGMSDDDLARLDADMIEMRK